MNVFFFSRFGLSRYGNEVRKFNFFCNFCMRLGYAEDRFYKKYGFLQNFFQNNKFKGKRIVVYVELVDDLMVVSIFIGIFGFNFKFFGDLIVFGLSLYQYYKLIFMFSFFYVFSK